MKDKHENEFNYNEESANEISAQITDAYNNGTIDDEETIRKRHSQQKNNK